jgi:hypothetical protein
MSLEEVLRRWCVARDVAVSERRLSRHVPVVPRKRACHPLGSEKSSKCQWLSPGTGVPAKDDDTKDLIMGKANDANGEKGKTHSFGDDGAPP